jgi:hypothetical protein
MMGCSTAGQIHGDTLSDGTLAVGIARFDATRLRVSVAPVSESVGSDVAGRRLAESLAGDDLRAVFLLSDGLLVNGSELVRGIGRGLPEDVIVTGGLAGDGDRFGRTWVLVDGKPTDGAVAAVGLYGDAVAVGSGSCGGWDIFGPERRITRASGNVLYELDGKPALALYKTYLGERASGLPATAMLFPLALRAHHDDPEQTVRTILAVDESDQSMTFAGDMPEGHLARFMHASRDRLVDGAQRAASTSVDAPVEGPRLAIAISCVGRRLVLGERTEEELEATLDALDPDADLVGFYSYGEIGPHPAGRCDLHNQTMTVTTIGEA